MVYEFHKVRKFRSELFVVFSQAADGGNKKFRALAMRDALTGNFTRQGKVAESEWKKVAAEAIIHDFVLPEQKLA